MKIHQERWCTLNKLEVCYQYVTNTLQYVGIRCHRQNGPKMVYCFIRLTYVRSTLHVSYAYVNVRYMYNSAYVRRSLCISFKDASDTLGIRFYTLIQV